MTVWAFDIETEDWSTFLAGCAHSEEGTQLFRTPEEVADWYASTTKDDLVLAHFGGRFDMLFLLDAVDAPWSGTLAGSSIVSMRSEGRAEVRDSFRLFPMPLGSWSGRKLDLPWVCKCNPVRRALGARAVFKRAGMEWKERLPSDCGGYCHFARHMSAAKRRTMEEYLVADCEALLFAFERDVARAESIGLEVRTSTGGIRRTIGGVAMATARRYVSDTDFGTERTFNLYDRERAGYYGGRTEVFLTRSPFLKRGERYDVNSMYPWALTFDVPAGDPVWHVDRKKARRALARQRPGIYDATLQCDSGDLPWLPMRVGESIVWASGTVTGTWTELEIRGALDRGAKLLDVESALVYRRAKPLYADYMREYYDHRAAATALSQDESASKSARSEAKAWAAWLKWILNATTGKLAQGPDSETLHVRDKVGDKKGRVVLSPGVAWTSTGRRVPQESRPAHAAYLTARSRLHLLARLERAGDDRVYCDTDSCYMLRDDPHGTHATKLGAWKHEGPFYNWRSLAPKVYTYDDALLRDDRERARASLGFGEHTKAKGIPYAGRDVIDTFEQEMLAHPRDDIELRRVVERERGVEGVKTAFKRHGQAFVKRHVKRAHRAPHRIVGTRYEMPDGRTRALHRSPDGVWTWPGVDEDPKQLLERLRNGE